MRKTANSSFQSGAGSVAKWRNKFDQAFNRRFTFENQEDTIDSRNKSFDKKQDDLSCTEHAEMKSNEHEQQNFADIHRMRQKLNPSFSVTYRI